MIVIGGPTSSGKSHMAQEIASWIVARGDMPCIINADSVQLYRDIPLLAASPSSEDMQSSPHRLYSVLSLDHPSSVAWWVEAATDTLNEMRQNGWIPIIVGGTGLYLHGLCEGMGPVPPSDAAIRQALMEQLAREGKAALYRLLEQEDPRAASRLHPNDQQRVCRALEVWRATGRSLISWQEETPSTRPFPGCIPLMMHLLPSKPWLDARIATRIDQCFPAMAEEIERLSHRYALEDIRAKPIGLRALWRYHQGEIGRKECHEAVIIHTRQYAKRQLTWFRHHLHDAHRIADEDAANRRQTVMNIVNSNYERVQRFWGKNP